MYGVPEGLLDRALQKWRPLQGFLWVASSLGPRRPHLLPDPLLHLGVTTQLEQSKLQGHRCLERGRVRGYITYMNAKRKETQTHTHTVYTDTHRVDPSCHQLSDVSFDEIQR